MNIYTIIISLALAAADADQAGRFHQPLNPLATDTDACIGKLSVDAWRPVGLPGGLVDRSDANRQIRIGARASIRWATAPCVVTSARDAEHLAHRLDGEHGLVRRHECEDRDDITSL